MNVLNYLCIYFFVINKNYDRWIHYSTTFIGFNLSWTSFAQNITFSFSKRKKCVQTLCFYVLFGINIYFKVKFVFFATLVLFLLLWPSFFSVFYLFIFVCLQCEMWPCGVAGSLVRALQAECSEDAHKRFAWQLVLPYWSLLESWIYLCCCILRSHNCHCVVTRNDAPS